MSKIKKYDYKFGIIDGEYILQMNKNLLVTEVKKPIETILKLIKNLESELEEDEEDMTKEEIEKKENEILNLYSRINFKKLEKIDSGVLFGTFIASIMKHKRENLVKYMIITFDKTPYYHKTAIENYKGDRYNSTEAAQELEEKLKDTSLSANRRLIYMYDKQLADYDTDNFWQYQKVKLSLIEREHDDWSKAGFHCISKRGYEADQLAYYLSTIISKQYEKDGKTNAVLLTADKDWCSFVQPGVIFTSIWNGNLADRHYGKLTEEWEEFHKDYLSFAKKQKLKEDWKDITRYDYGILSELFIASHNNATLFEEQEDDFRDVLIEKYLDKLIEDGGKNKRILKPMAKKMANAEIFFRIVNGCKNKKFKSYDIMKKAYKAMNVFLGKTVDNGHCENIGERYEDDIKPLCMSVLKECSSYGNGGYMINLCNNNDVSFNMGNYKMFVESLKENE